MCAVCVSLSLLLYPSASEPDYKRVVLHRSDFSEETLQRFPRAFLIRFLDLSSRFLPFSFFFISLFMFLLSRFRYVVFFSSSIPLPFSGRLVLSLSLSFHASSLPFSLSVFPLSCPLSQLRRFPGLFYSEHLRFDVCDCVRRVSVCIPRRTTAGESALSWRRSRHFVSDPVAF